MNTSFRFAALLALLVLVVAARASAADPDYWPLKEGNKWNLSIKVQDKAIPIIMQVAKIENIDGQQLARLETIVNGNVSSTEHLSNTDQGIFRHKINGADVTPPIPILRYPVKKGDTWNLEAASGTEKFKIDSSVDTEQVTVPAGTYEAAVVTTETTIPAGKILNKQWFAPGVGMVKQVFNMPDGNSITAELDKFDPAQ